jgi:hypothetical protein
MAQTGYTPIRLYYSPYASVAPDVGNLVAGELAINIADLTVYCLDNLGALQTLVWDVWPVDRGGIGNATGDLAGLIGIPSPRFTTYGSATSITFDADAADVVEEISSQPAGTLTITAPSGTYVDGRKIIFKLKSANPQSFAWDPIFVANATSTLPVVSSGSDLTDYMGFMYDVNTDRWQLLATSFGFPA